jgi:hypothetical protein
VLGLAAPDVDARDEVSPSRHSPSCWVRWVTPPQIRAAMPVSAQGSSGSSTRLPTMVVLVVCCIRSPILPAAVPSSWR